MGKFLDKTKMFLPAIRFCTCAMAILYGLSNIMLPIGNIYLTFIFSIFAGIFNVPILPACYGYSAVLTGSMPPSVVNGFMMSCAQLYSCAFSFFQAWLLQ